MLKQILTVARYPYLKQDLDSSFNDKLALLFKAYGLVFLSIFIIASPLIPLTDGFVTHILHFKSIAHQDKEAFRQMLQKTGYVFGLIYICLLGPIVEESVFRLPLSFKKIHIAISLGLAALLFGSVIPDFKTFGHLADGVLNSIIKIGVPVAVFFIAKKLLPTDIKLTGKAKKNLIVTSISLFGLMHISNYSPLQWPIIWIYPIFVVPQLIMGWLITYVRFKNGFLWGIALHCMINMTGMLFSLSSLTTPVNSKHSTTMTHTKKVSDTSTSKKK